MAKRWTESEEEKRRQRRVMFFGIFMIAVMLFSTFAYYMTTTPGTENQLEYGDYEFSYRDLGGGAGVLVAEVGGQEVEFQNLPVQVGFLQVDPQAIVLLQNANQVALSTSTNLSQENASIIDYARLQLTLAMPKAFNAMSEADARYALPVFTCADATQQLPVLLLVPGNESSVTVEGSCIILQGQDRSLLQLKDRLIFEYYGIMSNGVVVDE